MRTRAIVAVLACAGACANVVADDEIFAANFEYRCDGGGCTYCSPADPTPVCGANSHCLPDQGGSACTFPAGAGTSNVVCASNASCAGPYLCVDTGVSSTCQQWCQIPAGACPGGQTCTALASHPLIGTTEWGICL